ncbi:MAG: NAD(P)/FAD-dependent oxidoreductase, partial [Methanobrevibacter sp.]|nr:NAD(P)/FAD-dependent oxidoreductase [Methanobrevibacter sp.]
MNFDCDVLIVGAGPVGSTIAYQLGKNGLDVVIVEKKKQIGYPLQCAGILSKHIFSFNDLPDEIILNKVKGAFLHTQNHILNVEKESEVAYVIVRIAYDEFLLNRAVENGSKIINQKAIDFDVENGIVYLSDNKKIQAKIIIGCDGYNSVLS